MLIIGLWKHTGDIQQVRFHEKTTKIMLKRNPTQKGCIQPI